MNGWPGDVCESCGRSMTDAPGCTLRSVDIGRVAYSRLAYGHGPGAQLMAQELASVGRVLAERCHDCNARIGQLHHTSCDFEECPRCSEQSTTCGCLDMGRFH